MFLKPLYWGKAIRNPARQLILDICFLFFLVSSTKPYILCKDVWSPVLFGCFQRCVHAYLDGCHRHCDRWAQPLLTSICDFEVKLLNRLRRGLFSPFLSGEYICWKMLCLRGFRRPEPHRGTAVQTWRKLLLTQINQLQCRTWIFKGLTHGDSAVCYREDSLTDLGLPLLVTVQHYRSNVHYTKDTA